jgi:hypothetical protein
MQMGGNLGEVYSRLVIVRVHSSKWQCDIGSLFPNQHGLYPSILHWILHPHCDHSPPSEVLHFGTQGEGNDLQEIRH